MDPTESAALDDESDMAWVLISVLPAYLFPTCNIGGPCRGVDRRPPGSL